MSNLLKTMKRAVASIEGSLDVVKSEIAELEDIADAQALATDRDAWQTSVGTLLTLIEAHSADWNEPDSDRCNRLLDDAVRVVNTNPYTGNISEPRADVASMNTKATIERAIAAGLVVRCPGATDLGDLPAAIAILEADIDDDPDPSEVVADAMRVVVAYAQLAHTLTKEK